MGTEVTTDQFDSRHFPPSARLQKFAEHVLDYSMMKARTFGGINGDNPNVFLHERFLQNEIYFSLLASSGFISTAGPRRLDARAGSIAVGLLKSGSAEIRTEKDGFKLSDGDIYINATSSFEWTFAESNVVRLIFPSGTIKELLHRSGEFIVFRNNQPVTEILKATISGFESTLREGDAAAVNQMGRLAVDLSSRIIEEQILRSAFSGHEIIRERAREYIHDNFASTDLRIDEIASYVGTSRSTLYRSFEGIGGVREYIMSVRLEKAKHLIGYAEPERGWLSKIAFACGFGSVGQLSAAFKTRFGVSPTVFKNVDGDG